MIRPVFAFPPLPEGWLGAASRLVRIIDPAGDAIAWFDPLHATCAGYAVRTTTSHATFHHVLAAIPPLTEDAPSGGSATGREPRWRFVKRDPASCVLQREPDEGVPDAKVSMTASLDDGALSIAYRMPALRPPSLLQVTLGCTSSPLIRELPPGEGRSGHGSGTPAKGRVFISHDPAFVAAPFRTVTGPDGARQFIVTLELLRWQASCGRASSPEHSILVHVRTT